MPLVREAPRNLDEARNYRYDFWSTQPVPQFDEIVEENTFILADREPDQISVQPLTLPANLKWSDVDLRDDDQLSELYVFLRDHYVEDDDNMFRFDYSLEFLRWALLTPGSFPQWYCGIRCSSSNALVAFFSAVLQKIRIYDKIKSMVELNFLCVHSKFRRLRLTPLLYQEIMRRANREGIFQAAFTSGTIIPRPYAVCRYYHRSLNPKKLIECQFSALGRKMNMEETIAFYSLPKATNIPGLRALEKKDISSACKLFNTYSKQFQVGPVFEEPEFEHFFLPRKGIIYSFVVEKSDVVTDLISFYTVNTSVLQHPIHKKLNIAYSFYNIATSVSLQELMEDALILANIESFDVFNALNMTHLEEIFRPLKFGIGDGNLHYYFYNWKCPPMTPNQVALTLL
ncbi:unnamed protein product, partial [Mesorhabditis belari]|uniref:Glycylpeptide N-tetradecanoyltransferase n=1 Tax=Mesorhabditis belari TaxID=2138241 RepID=A0AAF3EMM3_9BILA